MTLYDTIRTALLEHFDGQTFVYLADGRDIVVAPDLESVAEFAAEIETAIVVQARVQFAKV